MKTVLITGAAGYLGSHLAKTFKLAGWKVVGFGHRRHTMNHYIDVMHYGDIRDRELLESLFHHIKFDHKKFNNLNKSVNEKSRSNSQSLNEAWVAGEMIDATTQAGIMIGVAAAVGLAWFKQFEPEIKDWINKNKDAGLKALQEFISDLKKKNK